MWRKLRDLRRAPEMPPPYTGVQAFLVGVSVGSLVPLPIVAAFTDAAAAQQLFYPCAPVSAGAFTASVALDLMLASWRKLLAPRRGPAA